MAPKHTTNQRLRERLDSGFSEGTSTLHVAIDFPWDASAQMGTGVYSEVLALALAAAAPQWRISLLVPHDAKRSIARPNIAYATIPPVQTRHEGPRQLGLPIALAGLQPDCLLAPATILPLVKTCPTITTVHDLMFRQHPTFYAPELRNFLDYWITLSVRSADHIVAISDESRAVLTEHYGVGDKVTVIYQATKPEFHQPLNREAVDCQLQRIQVKPPFLFHVSNLSPHKNVAFALQVFARFLRQDQDRTHRFLFAGGSYSPNQPPNLSVVARELGIEDRVKYLGRVDDSILKALYQSCETVLFPSLGEGWGLPVAEASQLGARVIASPHVPAASADQRIPLEVEAWVNALADPSIGGRPRKPVSFENYGGSLKKLIRQIVAASRHSQWESKSPTRVDQGIQVKVNSALDSRISGCTIVRNAVKLGYPLEESIASYAPVCAELVICWDPSSEDDTRALLDRIKCRFPQVRLVESVWDMNNRTGGTELARQTQIALEQCTREWTLYIQADEALHECDHPMIMSCIREEPLAGVSFGRRSFLHTLDQEIPQQRSQGLVRLFRTGLGRSIGDAMHVEVTSGTRRIHASDGCLFNYSRLGTDDEIKTRSDNLNRFYHDDTFIRQLDPDRNKQWSTAPFDGTHPAPIEKRYRSRGSRKWDAGTVQEAELPLTVLFTVDDIRPQEGCGLELDSGYVEALTRLNRDFGCRFTLFMPTNYHAALDLRDHADWFQGLLRLGCFEVACHGHHHWHLSPGNGEMEYRFESEQDAVGCVDRSLSVLGALGYRPRGVKAPGWSFSRHALKAIVGRFEYMADHFTGTRWDCESIPGLARLPYTRCIHEPLDDLLTTGGPLIVLHSHFSPESGKHDNGWSPENQDKVRRFLERLTTSQCRRVTFATAAESLANTLATIATGASKRPVEAAL